MTFLSAIEWYQFTCQRIQAQITGLKFRYSLAIYKYISMSHSSLDTYLMYTVGEQIHKASMSMNSQSNATQKRSPL